MAVVSRGGWQRHSWKGCNQDAFLALPLAVGSAACQGCGPSAACYPAAVAIGVFDGHGREGQAASSHLRNALASGLLMHNQLALLARQACQPAQPGGAAASAGEAAGSEEAGGVGADAASEAAALLERCFAAAASTMPSTGADFSLSGSTAVMCLVQPGRWGPSGLPSAVEENGRRPALPLVACPASTRGQAAEQVLRGLTMRPPTRCPLHLGAGPRSAPRPPDSSGLPSPYPVCSVTAAWAGDSRAVLGLHQGGRYIACALTRDHKPGRWAGGPCSQPVPLRPSLPGKRARRQASAG